MLYTKYPMSECQESVERMYSESVGGMIVQHVGRFCWNWDMDKPMS